MSGKPRDREGDGGGEVRDLSFNPRRFTSVKQGLVNRKGSSNCWKRNSTTNTFDETVLFVSLFSFFPSFIQQDPSLASIPRSLNPFQNNPGRIRICKPKKINNHAVEQSSRSAWCHFRLFRWSARHQIRRRNHIAIRCKWRCGAPILFLFVFSLRIPRQHQLT